MKSKSFASLLALAMLVLLPHVSLETRASERLTEIDISSIKSALRLTPAQLPYWTPLEATLIHLSRQQKSPGEHDGTLARISRRAVTIALDGASVARLASAARPLIATLDDGQKQTALRIAQQMGLGPMLARLN